METIPVVIQIIALTGASLFMLYVLRLVLRGQLREEYSIVWILCTIILIIFSIWRRGLEQISLALGVFYPPSLIFLAAIFAIIIFLVHISVVISRMQSHIKNLTHEMAYLRQELDQLKGQDAQKTDRAPSLS